MAFSCSDYTDRIRSFTLAIGLLDAASIPNTGLDDEYEVVFAALRRLAVQGAMFARLVEEASSPGGIGQHEFARPGGWREKALAAIDCGPLSVEVCRRIHDVCGQARAKRSE